jgi:hypothetical protein
MQEFLEKIQDQQYGPLHVVLLCPVNSSLPVYPVTILLDHFRHIHQPPEGYNATSIAGKRRSQDVKSGK